MPFWTPKFKFAGRVFAILRLRPTIDKEELQPRNGLAGHDRADLPPASRQPPTSMSSLTATRADPNAITQLHTSLSLSDISDDPVHQAHNHQSVSLFSHARDINVNGGEIYAVGGNLTVQRTGAEPREIADMLAVVRETLGQTRRLEEMMGGRLQLPSVISTGFLCVMDATGQRHTVTMDMAHSFEQFTAALRVLFFPEHPQNRVLLKFMDMDAFFLSIDDGREYLQLTDQEVWKSNIRGGMTIVMSVILIQEVYETTPMRYQCPFCECWNGLRENNRQSSIDCRSCKRRLQIESCYRYIDEVGTTSISNNERDLVHNIYLRQEMRLDLRVRELERAVQRAAQHMVCNAIPSAANAILTSLTPLKLRNGCVLPPGIINPIP